MSSPRLVFLFPFNYTLLYILCKCHSIMSAFWLTHKIKRTLIWQEIYLEWQTSCLFSSTPDRNGPQIPTQLFRFLLHASPGGLELNCFSLSSPPLSLKVNPPPSSDSHVFFGSGSQAGCVVWRYWLFLQPREGQARWKRSVQMQTEWGNRGGRPPRSGLSLRQVEHRSDSDWLLSVCMLLFLFLY